MNMLNFQTYFESTDKQYYEPKYIIVILESILGNKLEDIKSSVNNTQIIVTVEQITEFLENKMEEENPELKRRIESPKIKRSRKIGEWTQQDIKCSVQEIIDGLSMGKYCFDPYTLEYFNTYSVIVKNKALVLLNIIEKIGNKEYMSISNLISELDIQLDENGNISNEDIIRLITPTVYNINELNEKVTTANNLTTYLTFSMSKHSIYKDGCSEADIFPTKFIQIKSLNNDYILGNVSLSNNQREEIRQEQSKNIQLSIGSLFD